MTKHKLLSRDADILPEFGAVAEVAHSTVRRWPNQSSGPVINRDKEVSYETAGGIHAAREFKLAPATRLESNRLAET